MNIDVAESLCLSWLKRVKKCFIVQTNWRMDKDVEDAKRDIIAEIVRDVESCCKKEGAGFCFKKTKTGRVVLNNVECDALGLAFDQHQIVFHAMDVACHLKRDGLHYSEFDKNAGKKMNVSVGRVCAKMFKTALAVYLMTEVKDGELVFATPKIADGIKGRIEPTLKVFEGCLSKHGLRYRFNLIGGQNFYDQIESCVKQKGCVACDNELYMRSIEIHNMNPIQIATKKK